MNEVNNKMPVLYEEERTDIVKFLTNLKNFPNNTDIERFIIIRISSIHFLKMRDEVKKIEDDFKKLEYWISQKRYVEYMAIDNSYQSLESEYSNHGNYKFLLKHIQGEIETIELILRNLKHKPQIPEPEDEILFIKDIEKIVLMYEFGFFDFMEKKFAEHSPGKMHKLVFQMTGISTDNIKKVLQRINEDRLKFKEHFDKAKIQIGQVKQTNEVLK